jgi:hypothetical protein
MIPFTEFQGKIYIARGKFLFKGPLFFPKMLASGGGGLKSIKLRFKIIFSEKVLLKLG